MLHKILSLGLVVVLFVLGSSLSQVQAQEGEVCLTDPPRVIVGGSGVSGPVFVDNALYRDHVFEAFGGVAALDMETWAAFYVANEYGVPSIAFRSLSDLAGGGPGANEIGIFFRLAANNAALVGDAFFSELAKDWTAGEPVLVVSAFGAELESVLVLPSVEVAKVSEIDNNGDGEGVIMVYEGTWHGVPVLMVLSRVSMVPSGHVVTVMLENYDVSAMVFSGIAGGIDPELNIGDVTVPAQWANHSRSRYAREVAYGVFDAESDLPNFGMIFHNPTEGIWWLEADAGLLEVAERVADQVELEQCALS